VALSVLASVYLVGMLGETQLVLAVNKDIARGATITATDVGTVELPTGPTLLKPISADELSQVTAAGMVATTDLKEGQLLTETSMAAELRPPAGQSIVGVALAPNQMPTQDLHAGDTVRIVETPATGGEPPAEAPFTISATVLEVGDGEANLGEQTVVDVQVASSNAAALAARAATGRVAIVLDSTGQG
jgi:hypothetical protein